MSEIGRAARKVQFVEPPRFDDASFKRLMIACVDAGSSDVTIRSNRRVVAHMSGNLVPVTVRRLEPTEVEVIIAHIYGTNAMTQIKSGKPIDPSYEIRVEKGKTLRFRVNATGTQANGQDAVEITMRTIPSDPPLLSQLQIEEEICQNFDHPQGLVIVSGPTGSGKSTLLAAGIRSILETPTSSRKIITYEAPIEYVYTGIDEASESSCISQSEVPKHIEGGFAAAARNAVRRAPGIILFGECRDAETMSSVMEAANTGHMIYTTLHSLGVGRSIMRVAELFQGGEERLQMMKAAIDCLRMIVSQCLIRRADGGRTALREWLVFTPEIRDELLDMDDPMQIVQRARAMVAERGNDIETRIERLYADGVIEKAEYLKFRAPKAPGKKSDPTPIRGNPATQEPMGEAGGVKHVA